MDADVLIVGGGPAGLATAIVAAQCGLAVEVAEPRTDAIDKCCGEGLLPLALGSLARLGIAPDTLGCSGAAFDGIAFYAGRFRASAKLSGGLGVRRTVLHRLLQSRVRALGVTVLPASARLVDGQTVLLDNRVQRRARWIIGADGAQSAVRAAAGLGAGTVASKRWALRQHFNLASGQRLPNHVEVHWIDGAQAYITPVGVGSVGIAIVADAPLHDMAAALARFPAVAAMLDGATPASTPRGAVTVHRTLRAVHHGPVALVGDASGSVDAITGDGLSLAFAQALALGEALGAGDLSSYGRAHRALSLVPRLLSRTLLLMGAHGAMAKACTGLLAYIPALFPALLTLHAHTPMDRKALLNPIRGTAPLKESCADYFYR